MQKFWAAIARLADTFGVLGVSGLAAMIGGIGTGIAYVSSAAPAMNSVWWLFTFLGATAAALVLIALAGVAVRQWRNAAPATVVQAPVMQSGRPQTSETVALEIIDSRTFEGPGLTVAFDDKHFVNCTFKNCTVHYDGGPYKLTSCRREAGNMVFVTTDRKIFGALHVWKFLGMMSEQATQIAAVEIQKDRLQT